MRRHHHYVLFFGIVACGGESPIERSVALTDDSWGAEAPVVWQDCAAENARCNFSGTRQVRYGVDGAFNSGVHTGGVDCNNQTFGDPAPGRRKRCATAV